MDIHELFVRASISKWRKKKALQASKKLSNVYDEKKPSNYDGVRIDLLNLTADEYIKSFLELS